MPTYDFKNVKTGEVKEHFMSYTKLDEFKKSNPNLEQVISAPNMITRRDGDVLKAAGGGWNEVLQKVGEHYPDSDVAKTNNRRSAKRIKTDEIVQKHAKIQAAAREKK